MRPLLASLALVGILGCASKDAEHPSPSASPSGSAAPSAEASADAAPSAAPSASAAPSVTAAPSASGEAAPPSASAAASASPSAASSAPPSTGGAAWSYGGSTGPSFWGDLSAAYAPCKEGAQQSPIDIPSRIDAAPKAGGRGGVRPRDAAKDAAKDKGGAKDAAKDAAKDKGGAKDAAKDKGGAKDAAKDKGGAKDAAKDKGGAKDAAKDKGKAPESREAGPQVLGPLSLDYLPVPLAIHNDGHVVELVNQANNYLTIGPKRFELLRVQFHSPSEHTLAGKRFDLEMHLVHRAADGAIAIVAVLFGPGETAPALADLWKKLPKQVSAEALLVKGKPFDLGSLVDLTEGYYSYDGSETMPPCVEGVTWFVMKKTHTVATKDVERYRDLFGGRTNRMVMPLGSRRLVENKP
jgi:carbonic anhydrase